MKKVKVEYVNLDEDPEIKKLEEQARITEEQEKEFEELAEKHDKMIKDKEREMDKFDELIRKQEEKERELKKAYDDYIKQEKEMEELEERIFPRKQITVKLFPDAHKVLKVMATSKDTTLEKIATSIVEDKIYNMDIAKYVADEVNNAEEMAMLLPGFEDYSLAQYGYEQMQDNAKKIYDDADKLLKKGHPRKRINVKVYYQTHMKLRIMAAIQNRSLNNIVSSIIEDEVGVEEELDYNKLLDEIIEYKNIEVKEAEIREIKDKLNMN